MEFVNGTVFWDPSLPELGNAAAHQALRRAEPRAGRAASVDPRQGGPGGLRPAGQLFRTPARPLDQAVSGLRDRAPRGHGDADRVAASSTSRPTTAAPRLVHGDYRIDNMIFKPDGVAACSPCIDWELSTHRPPRSRTSAYQCMQWRFPELRDHAAAWATSSRSELGIPTEEQYVAKYCERMGIAGIPSWKFFVASRCSASRRSCRASEARPRRQRLQSREGPPVRRARAPDGQDGRGGAIAGACLLRVLHPLHLGPERACSSIPE